MPSARNVVVVGSNGKFPVGSTLPRLRIFDSQLWLAALKKLLWLIFVFPCCGGGGGAAHKSACSETKEGLAFQMQMIVHDKHFWVLHSTSNSPACFMSNVLCCFFRNCWLCLNLPYENDCHAYKELNFLSGSFGSSSPSSSLWIFSQCFCTNMWWAGCWSSCLMRWLRTDTHAWTKLAAGGLSVWVPVVDQHLETGLVALTLTPLP